MDRLVKPESDDRESIDHAAVSSSLGPQGEQKIVLQGNDASNTYPIFSRECDIISSKNSSEQRINASNKIKVSKLVNFEWEQRYTNGNLIAVHKSNQYFAYSIRLESNGKVRVFNRRLNEKTLLKSFKGRVVDLAFAHCDSQILLGCVDETGALQIFQLTLDADSKIHSNVVFHLAGLSPSSKQHPLGEQDFNRLNSLQHQSVSSQSSSPIPVSQSPSQTTTSSSSGGSSSSTTHRIIWCTFVPEPSQEQETSTSFDDASQVFVLCRKSRAHVFNLPILLRLYDCAKGPIDVEELQSGGHLCIDEHKSTILTASFSPDGTAIATACIDGEIGFFKISFSIDGVSTGLRSSSTSEGLSLMSKQTEEDDKESGSSRVRALNAPKCLKKWKPHENRPITALYFLDDHKSPSLDAQFWNFILTGTDFNRELKIWDCRNWECLQTLRFHSADPVTKSSTPLGGLPVFKTAIDLSSKYLVMSDIMRKCFLVLHLQTDFVNNKAECFAVSEFLLAYPALHFAIIETAKIRARKYNQLNNVNQSEVDSNSIGPSDDLSLASNAGAGASNGGEGSDDHQLVSTVRLYCIQTKQLQEMEIYLSGEQSENFYNLGASPPPPPIAIAPPIVSSSQASSLLSTSLTVTPGNITGPNLAASSSSSILQQLLSNPNLSGEGLIPQRQTQKPAINLGPRKSESSELISRDENTTSSLNFNNSLNVNDDSAIIHVVAPPVPPQNGQLGINTTPSNPATYLMTPDAFLNSPTTRKSIDLTMTSTNQNAESKPTQHHGSSTSRTSTSSLTNVTASVIGAGASQSGSQVKQHFGGKTRTRSSSSSSSSSTTSSSSSSSSNMDADDKEIANTLSKGRGINSNKNKVHETDLAKAESLLNKVRIEPIETITPRSAISGVEKENGTDNHSYHNQQQQQFMLTSKSFNMEVPPAASSNDDTGITVDMKNLLIQMTNALKSQHEEIENLKKHQITSQLQLKSQIDSTLKQLFVNQQQQLQQQQQQLAIMHQDLANVLRKDAAASRSTISANSSSDLDNRLAQVVRDEMGKMREKLVEPLRQQLARELAEQLKIVDTSVKEHLSKMFKSKSTLDLIAQSIGQSAQPTVVNSYRDAFQKILIPNFEKSCQSMYQQVNASFSKGTQDYLTEFEQHRRALDESREPISTEMKKVNGKVEHLEKHLTELGQNLSRIFAEQMRQNSAVMQDAIISSMKAIVKEEVHLAMRDQPDRLIALMRQSGTMTPVPMNSSGNSSGLLSQTPNKTQPTIADVKTQIQFFLSKNQYNSAFQVALCAADLELLTNLCEQCQPASVFEVTVNAATKKPQCQLAQPVLLSLIQQLSQDLSNQLEIKLKYLEEAVYNLDPMSPLTREHTPQVIPQLVAKINHHLSSHPNDKFARPLRMLSLASQALLPKSSSSAAARQQQQTQHDNF